MAMVASYSELYEEGEVEHINGVWPVSLLKTAKISSNYFNGPHRGVALSTATRVIATSAFGLAPLTAWSNLIKVSFPHNPSQSQQVGWVGGTIDMFNLTFFIQF